VAWRSAQPPQIDTITLAGEVVSTVAPEFIEGVIQQAAIGDDGTIYASHWRHNLQTWLSEVTVSAMTQDGQELWTTQTTLAEADDLVATPEGGVALLASRFSLPMMDRELLVFSSLGQIAWTVSADTATAVAVAPDGRIALAGSGMIQIFDPNGVLLTSDPLPAIDELLGLRFVDDARLVLAGSLGLIEPTEAGDAAFGMVELGGAGWVSSYADSRVVCDGQPTGFSDEAFGDIVVLPDGGFLLAGVERRIGTGWEPLPSKHSLVARLDADAQVMAVDRGAWQGVTLAPVVAADGSAMVLINHTGSPKSYQIRKYLP
jgi:hypothetical protein